MIRENVATAAFCLSALWLGGVAPAGAGELLHFDFNDSAHLGAQAGGLPAGTVIGAVSAAQVPGAAAFGAGTIKLPGFPGPKGPFSIEARFRIREYAGEDSRFAADILNSATWNSDPPETQNVPTQGFNLRVGGSGLYPVFPRDRYATEQEWQEAQTIYSHIDRGRMTVCFADFVIARRDIAGWKQVFTDRCIERGKWTHLAAVWDGTDMRIYMNGLDATDSLRVDGAGKPIRIDSVQTVFVGARADRDWDPRRFDGDVDFVRMEDKALTAGEIRARFKETYDGGKPDTLCWGVVIPAYPEAGRVLQGGLRIETKVFNHGACTDPKYVAGFLAGDSVEIELAKDPAFDPVVVRARFSNTSFEVGPALLAPLIGYVGPIYWRVRLIPASGTGALAKSAAAAPEWSPARPIILDLTGPAVRLRPARPILAAPGTLLTGATAPAIFDLSGRRVAARFRRIGKDASGQTLWRLESMPSGSGLLLAR